jgi:hypothetical protein
MAKSFLRTRPGLGLKDTVAKTKIVNEPFVKDAIMKNGIVKDPTMDKKRRTVPAFAWIVSSVFFLALPGIAQKATAQDKPAADPAKRQVYFGEQHMHTRNSFDAFTVGVKNTWEDAYRFAMGEEFTLSTTGQKMKRRTPYDFVAITDHSEYYGVLKDLINPANPLSKSDFAKQLARMETDPKAAGPAVQKLIETLVQNDPMSEYVTSELRVGNWKKFIATADKF